MSNRTIVFEQSLETSGKEAIWGGKADWSPRGIPPQARIA